MTIKRYGMIATPNGNLIGKSRDGDFVSYTDHIAALRREREPVKIKSLVWFPAPSICTREKAEALGGHYSVVEFDAGTSEAHFATNIDLGGLAFVFILEPDPMGGRRPKRYPTIEAAKAAAQADYEARILAALEPDPSALALVAAAYRNAANIVTRAGHSLDAEILARTPADAQATLTAIERAAYERGVRDAAQTAFCHSDNRPSRYSMDWNDGYIDGCRGANEAILALLTREGR